MKIALANDHAGFALKNEIKAYLEQEDYEVVDFGCYNEATADLPDYIYPAAVAVASGEVEKGIFVDGVGYGSAMIANKLPGVYAACCEDPFCAGLARSHSNTNVLCLGGKLIGSAIAMEIVKTWLTTDYLVDIPKYTTRVAKVIAISEKHIRPLNEIIE